MGRRGFGKLSGIQRMAGRNAIRNIARGSNQGHYRSEKAGSLSILSEIIVGIIFCFIWLKFGLGSAVLLLSIFLFIML